MIRGPERGGAWGFMEPSGGTQLEVTPGFSHPGREQPGKPPFSGMCGLPEIKSVVLAGSGSLGQLAASWERALPPPTALPRCTPSSITQAALEQPIQGPRACQGKPWPPQEALGGAGEAASDVWGWCVALVFLVRSHLCPQSRKCKEVAWAEA